MENQTPDGVSDNLVEEFIDFLDAASEIDSLYDIQKVVVSLRERPLNTISSEKISDDLRIEIREMELHKLVAVHKSLSRLDDIVVSDNTPLTVIVEELAAELSFRAQHKQKMSAGSDEDRDYAEQFVD